MKKEKLLEFAFTIHDFNNDGIVDINDCYDLMYVGRMVKTESHYLLHSDATSIFKALQEK